MNEIRAAFQKEFWHWLTCLWKGHHWQSGDRLEYPGGYGSWKLTPDYCDHCGLTEDDMWRGTDEEGIRGIMNEARAWLDDWRWHLRFIIRE